MLKKHGTGLLQYKTNNLTDFNGFIPLKTTIARRFNLKGDPNKRIIVTNGGMETISFILQSMSRGTVLAEHFMYDRFITAASLIGHKVYGVTLDKTGINIKSLKSAISHNRDAMALYQIPYHQNPTGFSTSMDNTLEVAHLCQKSAVFHICDLAYVDLRYDGQLNEILPLDEKEMRNICIVGSFTKTVSPGSKCGYGIFPENIFDKISNVVANLRLNPNYITQAAINLLIESGQYDSHLEYLRSLYSDKLGVIKMACDTHLPDIEFTAPNGGFFTLLHFPGVSRKNKNPDAQKIDESKLLIDTARKYGVEIESAINCVPENARPLINSKLGSVFVRLTFPSLNAGDIYIGIKKLGEACRSILS